MAINTTRDDEELKESIKIDVLKRLFAYLKNYKKEVVIVTVLILITVAIGIVSPLIIQRIIDVEIVNKDVKGLAFFIGVSLLLAVINLIANRIWRNIMADVSNDVVFGIRRSLYIHIQELGLDFFDGRPAGKILARVTGDVNSLKEVLSSTITQLIPEALTVVTVLVVMIVVNPILTLSAVAAVPIILIGVFLCEIVAHRRWQMLRKKDSNMSAFIHEDIAGITIIQSFHAQDEAAAEFDEIVDEHKKAFRDAVLVADLFSPTIELSYGVGAFLLYFIAIKVLGLDASSIGVLTAFAMYLGMLWGPIRNLANYYNKLITNITAAERIFEIMDLEPNVKDQANVGELPEIQGRVSFEEVSFAYPDEPETAILKDVSFAVKEGETIALVGPTGAGKTTIVSLISRFYNATAGKVIVDETDVKDVSIHSLRKQMGIMTQDSYLFTGTIKDNIRYGRLDASDEEIEAAAKAVHAHDFIMKLKDGYDTKVSERGSGLSNGQKQLIAFARTIVSDPKILILDEATSSIDTQTEIMVQKGIQALLANRTSFVVAHRLSTIRNADRIFVIDNGGILEEGNHETLMEKKGAYYKLYTAQT